MAARGRFTRVGYLLTLLLAVVIISVITGGFYIISTRANERSLEQASRPVSADLYVSLKTDGLIPIARPAAHDVGSIFRTTSGDWYQRSSVCFPKLPTPTVNQSTLPNAYFHNLSGIGLALGLDKIVKSQADTQTSYRMTISYRDVVVLEVPEGELLGTFDRTACPELAAQIDSIMSGTPPNQTGTHS
jgi:hypothetical protein